MTTEEIQKWLFEIEKEYSGYDPYFRLFADGSGSIRYTKYVNYQNREEIIYLWNNLQQLEEIIQRYKNT